MNAIILAICKMNNTRHYLDKGDGLIGVLKPQGDGYFWYRPIPFGTGYRGFSLHGETATAGSAKICKLA